MNKPKDMTVKKKRKITNIHRTETKFIKENGR